jgi:hypothetical protein
MSLTNEERQNLVRRELEKAHEAYEDIEILRLLLYHINEYCRKKKIQDEENITINDCLPLADRHDG